MRITVKNPILKIFPATAAGILYVHVAMVMLFVPLGFLLRVWTPPVNSLMIHRAVFSSDKVLPLRRVPLRDLPRNVPGMFIYLEDHGFYSHGGIDVASIKTAHRRNVEAGRLAYGGSTITQQLARTLFLSPHKNYLRKYMEAVIAVEMDLLLPKDRIMELYLNHIEWGRGVFGIGRAAEVYYRKEPANLSVDQFRRLAAVISSPRLYTVRNLERHLGLRQRYQHLVRTFSG